MHQVAPNGLLAFVYCPFRRSSVFFNTSFMTGLSPLHRFSRSLSTRFVSLDYRAFVALLSFSTLLVKSVYFNDPSLNYRPFHALRRFLQHFLCHWIIALLSLFCLLLFFSSFYIVRVSGLSSFKQFLAHPLRICVFLNNSCVTGVSPLDRSPVSF